LLAVANPDSVVEARKGEAATNAGNCSRPRGRRPGERVECAHAHPALEYSRKYISRNRLNLVQDVLPADKPIVNNKMSAAVPMTMRVRQAKAYFIRAKGLVGKRQDFAQASFASVVVEPA